jgi:hypothetical protein
MKDFPISDEAKNYVDQEMNVGGVVIRPFQLMPAAANTYVLFKVLGAGEEKTPPIQVPVIAWGIWDAFLEENRNDPKKWIRKSGPFIYELGHLWPADAMYPNQFIGVRIGRWQSIDGGEEGWLENVKEPYDGAL